MKMKLDDALQMIINDIKEIEERLETHQRATTEALKTVSQIADLQAGALLDIVKIVHTHERKLAGTYEKYKEADEKPAEEGLETAQEGSAESSKLSQRVVRQFGRSSSDLPEDDTGDVREDS